MPSSPVTTAFITHTLELTQPEVHRFVCFSLVKPTVEYLKIQSEKQTWCVTWQNKHICTNVWVEFLFGNQSYLLWTVQDDFFLRFMVCFSQHFCWGCQGFTPWCVKRWTALREARHVIKGWERQMEETTSSRGIDLQGKQPFYKHHS